MPPILTEEEAALDPYALLGVNVDSTHNQIQKAFRKQSLKCHPDRNPDNPNAAKQFHLIQIAQDILLDPAKRAYLNSKADEDRRRKEKMAGMEKRRRGMVDSLLAREEEAKKAKIARFDAMQQLNEEERIKEAGRQMRAAAQARAAQVANVSEKVGGASRNGSGGDGGLERESRVSDSVDNTMERKDEGERPPISPQDVTLTLQFPSVPMDTLPPFLTSTEALTAQIGQRYGPVEHVVLMNGKPGDKKKGGKAIVEFKTRNWDGCWACWRDHQEGGGLLPKTKVKWAGGEAPAWISWAEKQHQSMKPNATESITPPSMNNNSQRPPGPATSFPAFGSSVPPPSNTTNGKDDLESTTLLRMRQLERERMAERMRREEEEEA